MKKTLVMLLLVLAMVGLLSVVANAGYWKVTSHSSTTVYTTWQRVYTAYNYSTSSDSFSYSYQDSKTVTINAEVGLDKVVSAKIGVSAGQTITKTVTYNGTLPARSYRYIDTRWAKDKDYGLADYIGDWWNPFDNTRTNVSWSAFTPAWIEIRASAAYSL